MIKALINRSADVSTHTPQDTKAKQPGSRAGVVRSMSVCSSYEGAPIFHEFQRCFVFSKPLAPKHLSYSVHSYDVDDTQGIF